MSPRRGLDAETVLDAAERLADERGFEAVTMHELARILSVRTPSLYHHVQGLDAVRGGLRLRALRAMATVSAEAAAGRAAHEAIRAFAHAQRRYAREHPGLYAAAQITVHRDAGPELRASGEETLRALVAWMRDGYGLEGEPALHAIRVLRSGVHGFIALESAGAWGMDVDVDGSFEALLDTLDRGLTATATR
jgi:AcrR family transcriptional regulator